MQQCLEAVVRIGTEMLGIRQTRRKSKSLVQKTGGGGMGVKQVRSVAVLCWAPLHGGGLWWGEQQMPSVEWQGFGVTNANLERSQGALGICSLLHGLARHHPMPR